MAQYAYTAIGYYDPTVQGGPNAGLNDPADGTITTGTQGDPTMSVGDTWTINGEDYTMIGTFTINGVEYPAAEVTTVGGDPALLGLNALFVEGVAPPQQMSENSPAFDTADFTACFAAGTEIGTANGFTLVEDLKIGDTVRTIDGRDVAVKWVGHQTVVTRFAPAERVLPVKFAAGSLGGGLPTSDLVVTNDHAMLLGDTLCNAGALINGTTITRVSLAEMGERFTVYHVETENHEVILANGAAAETYIDNVSREVFHNYAEFQELYGDVAEMEELAYPRAMTERQVPAAITASLASEKVA